MNVDRDIFQQTAPGSSHFLEYYFLFLCTLLELHSLIIQAKDKRDIGAWKSLCCMNL